jgi:hypothetical protein
LQLPHSILLARLSVLHNLDTTAGAPVKQFMSGWRAAAAACSGVMRRLWLVAIFALSAVTVLALPAPGLADDDEAPAALGYQSIMIGLAQVPPVASVGRGLASYLITEDSATLYYSVQVLDVSSTITMAHIHLGRAGQNGDVVVNLCGAGNTPACAAQGVIASGSVSASSLVGPLAGHPLGDLIAAMTSGGAYTNVHTSNFPNGEIRGQVLLVASVGEHENDQGENNQGDNGNDNHDDHEGDD